MSKHDELVKALRCCTVDACGKCPYDKYGFKCATTMALDAAAAIEALEAEVKQAAKRNAELHAELEKWVSAAEKAAQPHWVSVEQPPKEHMWCFVYTDEPDMIMPIRIAFYTASCMGKGSWYHYESGSDITDEVDYWAEMLLEGPKLDHDLPWPIEPPQEVQDGQ